MARLWTGGFELNQTSAQTGDSSSYTIISGGGNAGTVSTPVRTGTYAGQIICNTAGRVAWDVDISSQGASARIFGRAYIYVVAYPSISYAPIFGLGTAAAGGGNVACMLMRSTGTLVVGNQGSASGTESAQVPLNTWTRIEFDFDDAADTITGYLNGTSFASASVTTVAGAGRYLKWGFFGATNTTGQFIIDDVAVNDSSGSYQNSLPGSGKVFYLRPASTGDSNVWSSGGGGTAGAANNYTRVNEVQPQTAQLNTSTDGTETAIDDFGITSSATAGIGSSDTVKFIAVNQFVGAAGTSATCQVRTRIKGQSGGTVSESAAFLAGNTTHGIPIAGTAGDKKYLLTAYVNPQTGSAWTASTIDTAQIGYRSAGASTTQRQLAAMWAVVEYDPAVGATGSAAITLPAVTSTSSGTALSTASSSMTLPPLAASGSGIATASASSALTLPSVAATGSGSSGVFATSSIALPAMTVSASGSATATGSATVLFPPIKASAQAQALSLASAFLHLPMVLGSGSAQMSATGQAALLLGLPVLHGQLDINVESLLDRRYPDVERVLAGVLVQFSGSHRAGTETPQDLAAKLPFIRVTRRGGPDDSVTDRARVDVEIFAVTRAAGIALAEQVRQYMIRTQPFRPGDPFDRITCNSGPQELPWGDGKIRRWIMSFTVSSRRVAA